MGAVFPGTVIARNGKNAEDFFNSLFFVADGIMLFQVREITGLDTPVIQNWVNRGWVQKPVNKKYSANHLARIIIINMLRDVARLELIANILTYINGNADSEDDDVISESKLYIYICEILDNVDYEVILNNDLITEFIRKTVSDYNEPFEGAKEKLINGIKIILLYFAASLVKVRADKIVNDLSLFIK